MNRSAQAVKVVRVELTREDVRRLRSLGVAWRGAGSDRDLQRTINTLFAMGLDSAEEFRKECEVDVPPRV
jgi:Ni,Fe-hydrogenase III large subunit